MFSQLFTEGLYLHDFWRQLVQKTLQHFLVSELTPRHSIIFSRGGRVGEKIFWTSCHLGLQEPVTTNHSRVVTAASAAQHWICCKWHCLTRSLPKCIGLKFKYCPNFWLMQLHEIVEITVCNRSCLKRLRIFVCAFWHFSHPWVEKSWRHWQRQRLNTDSKYNYQGRAFYPNPSEWLQPKRVMAAAAAALASTVALASHLGLAWWLPC